MTVIFLFQPHHLVADLLLFTSRRDFRAQRLPRSASSRVGHLLARQSPHQGRFPIRDQHLAVFVERDSRCPVLLSRRHRSQPSDPGIGRFERSPTELSALISMDLGRSPRCRQSSVANILPKGLEDRPQTTQKERATRWDRPHLPPECGATPRVPPLHSLSRGHSRETLRVDHTISDATRSASTRNSEFGNPHGCPPETALIPI